VQVNKKLNPDQYQLWKDSVKQSIADLGTPMRYDQTFNVTYNLPFQFIPVLDWINSSVTYNATYNWDRGAIMDESIEIGNSLRNQRKTDWQGNFNLLSLYNKNKFLKEVNSKFGSTRTRAATPKKVVAKVVKTITLNTDSGTVVEHGMLTKKPVVTAKGANGRTYRIKFSAVDFSKIRVENLDTVTLTLTFAPVTPPTEKFFYKAAEHGAYFLMMLKRFNVQYSSTGGMMIPGYRPEIGGMFGQGNTGSGLAPGLGFAFGNVSRSYINDLADRDWLVMNQNNINPAIMSGAKTLTLSSTLEPFSGLKIDLNATRQDTRNTEIQYMYYGMPELMGGNFTMTTMALSSAFGGVGNASNNYASKAFDKFLQNRAVVAHRLERQYAATQYPNAGFLQNTSMAGKPYNPGIENGAVNPNSTDVLIPAFLAAYTGGDAGSIGLSAFPSLKSLLPNWRISYDGLIRIPAVKKYFKNIMLSHQYRCTYNVGSFSSYLNWVDAGNGLGFTQDVATSNPAPSSPYSISAVSITEGFSPLVGIDGTLLNNVTLRSEYRTSRNLNLNITSFQLVESLTNEFIVGGGYKLTEFNKVLKMKASQNFSNDLTLRLDYSYRKMQSIIRKLQDASAQATSGNVAKTIQFSAEYGLSKSLSIRGFYDLQINNPLISSAAYPTSNSNYGISLRFTLTQ
jgi:cell surface protein SprA